MLRKPAAVLLVLAAAGCGAQTGARADREWTANARGVVEQLRQDVVDVSGFDRVGDARVGLHDDSQLYGLLVAYTDFGGCRHMVAALGAQPRRFGEAARQLGAACADLSRADDLFTRAVARNDPRLLVRATAAGVRALGPLDRARLALPR